MSPSAWFSRSYIRTTFVGYRTRNNVCINVSSSIIHSFLLADLQTCPSASILSTYVMKYIQSRPTDEEIWRNTKSNLYWQAEVWVVPIHLSALKHRVVCTIYIKEGKVLLFDSFAEQMTLDSIIPVRVSSHFFTKISLCFRIFLVWSLYANAHGHPLSVPLSDWVAQPLVVSPSDLMITTY